MSRKCTKRKQTASHPDLIARKTQQGKRGSKLHTQIRVIRHTAFALELKESHGVQISISMKASKWFLTPPWNQEPFEVMSKEGQTALRAPEKSSETPSWRLKRDSNGMPMKGSHPDSTMWRGKPTKGNSRLQNSSRKPKDTPAIHVDPK